jgi:hypothetical protein
VRPKLSGGRKELEAIVALLPLVADDIGVILVGVSEKYQLVLQSFITVLALNGPSSELRNNFVSFEVK